MTNSATPPARSPPLPLTAYPRRLTAPTATRHAPATRRRRGLGNRYGPTYAVTSRSAGSASRGGSVTPTTLRGPRRLHPIERPRERLGEHPDLGDAGHEVRVTGPAGH